MPRQPSFAAYLAQRPGLPKLRCEVRAASPFDALSIAVVDAERGAADLGVVVALVRQELEALAAGDPHRCCIVAEHDGRVVGYGRAGFKAYADAERARGLPSGWYLTGVVVGPAWRGRGVGEALTRRRLELLRARGAREAFMFTNTLNRVSIALHEKLGFEHVPGDIAVPGITYDVGAGALYRIDLIRRLTGPATTATPRTTSRSRS